MTFTKQQLIVLLVGTALAVLAVTVITPAEASAKTKAGCVKKNKCNRTYIEIYNFPSSASQVEICFKGNCSKAKPLDDNSWAAYVSMGKTVYVGKTYTYDYTFKSMGKTKSRSTKTKLIKWK